MKTEMSEHSPSGWYKCKLKDFWTMQWVVCYYASKDKIFYFGTEAIQLEGVIEVKEYVMDSSGNPMNNIVH